MLDDTQTEVTETEAPAEAAPVSLGLNDLANLKQIVEVVAQRGAFRADEMTVVGNTYNKLSAFLKAALPAPAAEATEETAATEEAESEA